MMPCTGCGRDLDRLTYCSVCDRELVCGKVSEQCPIEGCRERRLLRSFHENGGEPYPGVSHYEAPRGVPGGMGA